MRRGLLQDYANTTCAIATGWRSFNDLDRMQEIGRGEVVIDLLAATVSLDGAIGATFSIADEIVLWFASRRSQDRVPDDLIREATVTILFETYETDHYSVWIRSSSRLRTLDTTYTGAGELGRRRETP